MYRTISSRLTAFFSPDGSHLHRYLQRTADIKKSLCEDLILHDQVLIPTQDFLTASGLILILGEQSFNELLDTNRLKFVRTRGVFGFVRGAGVDGGLAVFGDPTNKRPQDAPLEESVEAGLRVIQDRLKDRKQLHRRILEHCFSIEWDKILSVVRKESIRDLKASALWRPEYEFDNEDLVALPGIEPMQVRVIGTNPDPGVNVVDGLLALVLYNSELYLAEEFESQNTSPFFPIGDLLEIKARRLMRHRERSVNLWSLLEINGVPDFATVDFTKNSTFSDLLRVFSSKDAAAFRKWFQEKQELSEKEILAGYVSVLKQVPWIERLPTKVLRFAITTGVGLIPVAGQLVSAFDTFVVNRLFRGHSPRFFIDDLTKATGRLKP